MQVDAVAAKHESLAQIALLAGLSETERQALANRAFLHMRPLNASAASTQVEEEEKELVEV